MKDFVRSLPVRNLSQQSKIYNFFRLDWWLVSLLLCLIGYGLLVLWSALDRNESVFYAQLIKIGVALLFAYICSFIHPLLLKRWGWYFYFAGILCLCAVLLFGVEVNGSQRWLNLYFFRVQPSELMKLIVPIVLSAYLVEYVDRLSLRHSVIIFFIGAFPAILIALQPDLGTAILVMSSSVVMLFLFGIPFRWIVRLLIALVLFFSFYLVVYFTRLSKGKDIDFFEP